MNKQIMISIRPEHAVNILNGKKTLELRKSVPKDFIGWVNVYCTKRKKIFRVGSLGFYEDELYKLPSGEIKFGCSVELMASDDYYDYNNFLNGKVVARFWFDETYYIKQAVNVYGDELNQISIYDNKSYGWKAPKEQQEILKQLCLTEQDVLDYVKGKGANAWHIKKLEVFYRPMQLGEFYTYQKKWVFGGYDHPPYYDEVKTYLTKAPQSWRYVYYAN